MKLNYSGFFSDDFRKERKKPFGLLSKSFEGLIAFSICFLFFQAPTLELYAQEKTTECHLVVDAGSDISLCEGESATLTAAISNEADCSNCEKYDLENTVLCKDDNIKYLLYLKKKKKNKYYANENVKWTITGENSAKLSGIVYDIENPDHKLKIEAYFWQKTKNPPKNSPKHHDCNTEDASDWTYYKKFKGTISTLSGNWKMRIRNTGPAFQIGNGANVTENESGKLGGSGWFNTNSRTYSNGDFNFNVGSCTDSNSNEVQYLWSNGETTPAITVTEPGEYSVEVIDCNDCKASDAVSVEISDPSIDAGEDVTINDGDSVKLNGISGADRVTWSVNGEIIYTATEDGDAPEVSPSETTTYEVTATFGTCTATDTVTITVDSCEFSVDLGDNKVICNGEPVNLTAYTSGDDNGGCTSFSLENTNYCSAINTYLVSLGDQQNRIYLINQSVVWEELNETDAILTGIAVNSNDPTDTYTINVIFVGKTTTPPDGSPRMHTCYTVDPSGWTYYPTFAGTIESMTDGSVININRRGPSFQLGKGANDTEQNIDKIGGSGWFVTDSENYRNGDVNFNLGSCLNPDDTMIYEWSTGETTASISIDEPGEYSVTVTNEEGCEASDTITIIDSNVSIDAGTDINILPGETVKLDPIPGGADKIEWLEGNTIIFSTKSPSRSPEVSPSETTTYVVRARFGECIVEDTVTVNVVTCQELADIGDTVSICSGEQVELSVTVSNATIEWSTGETSPSITVSPSESTIYSVTLTSADGCQSSDTAAVLVQDNFTVSLENPGEVCPGDEVQLEASIEGSDNSSSTTFVLEDTNPCGLTDPQEYVLWLHNGSNRYFSNVDLEWQQFNNGIARLTGTVFDYSATQQEYEVDVILTGGTSTPPSDPKMNNCYDADPSGWFYYPEFSGTITAVDGSWQTSISRRGPSFQVGAGANNTESTVGSIGGSGWFDTTDTEFTIGDINFNVGDLMERTFSYEWSNGNSTATTMVSPTETETYQVTVTDSNGCSVTEEITIVVSDEACEEEISSSQRNIKVYPTIWDRSMGNINVALQAKTKQKVSLALYNLNGALQTDVNVKSISKGSNTIQFETNSGSVLESGIYMLRIIGDGIDKITKVIVK